MNHEHDCTVTNCSACQECGHQAQPLYDPINDTGSRDFNMARYEMPQCVDCTEQARRAPYHDYFPESYAKTLDEAYSS